VLVWQACLWGLLGAVLIEVRGLWSAYQPLRVPKWPWKDGRGRLQVQGYIIAVACRFTMAAGLDAVYAASHQIAGPLGAVTLGITAPLVIQQMAVRGEAPAAPELVPTSNGQTPAGTDSPGGLTAQSSRGETPRGADVP
jgi:hypothetical protein